MPRRDWNANLDREYERLYEQLPRAGAARLGPRRPVRSLPDVPPRGPRPHGGPPHRLIEIALLRAVTASDRRPNASFGQMTVVTSR
jgi:hypothetical protein